jgi:hypothetical protein
MKKKLDNLKEKFVIPIIVAVIAGIILTFILGNNYLQSIKNSNQVGDNYQIKGDNNSININNPSDNPHSVGIKIEGGSNIEVNKNTIEGYDTGIEANKVNNLSVNENMIR